MAKNRKLLKALEAEGWRPTVKRGTLVQMNHPKRPGRLTLPATKCTLPGSVAAAIATAGGIKLKGE